MRGFLLHLAAALAAAVLAAPAPSLAADALTWPVAPAPPLLAYGDTYTGEDGSERTHSGIDVPCEEGAVVAACAEGVVSFAGMVPAGEGRVLAVTVETPDGLSVTCMPLSSARVSKGTAIAAGEAVGEAAGAGDPSSASPHLHVSVRRGGTYLDPMSMLPEPVAPEGPPAPEPLRETAPAPEAASPAPAPAALEARPSLAPEPEAPAAPQVPAAVTATPRTAVAPAGQAPAQAPAAAPPPAASTRDAAPLPPAGVQVPVPSAASGPSYIREVQPARAARPGPSGRTPVRDAPGQAPLLARALTCVGATAPLGRRVAAAALAAAMSAACVMMVVLRTASSPGMLGVVPSVEKTRVEDAVGR